MVQAEVIQAEVVQAEESPDPGQSKNIEMRTTQNTKNNNHSITKLK